MLIPYIQNAYLTQAATCNQGASLELLLSSAASLLYMGYPYIKYQLPAGPVCPSSHDLPWLSKPLILLIYTTTWLTPAQTQGIHPTLSQTSCNTCVTLTTWHNTHPPLGTSYPLLMTSV